MKWLWILWGFDACCALVALYFFGSGVTTATNLSDYLAGWLAVLAAAAAILVGGILLKNAGYLFWAKLCLLAGAVPGLLWGGLFLAMMLFGNNKWN